MQQLAFVPMDGFVSGEDRTASGCGGGIGTAAQVFPVINGGFDSCDAFVVQSAPLPTIWNFVSIGADFVGAKVLQMFPLSIENAHVRTEEFVSRANEEIAVDGADVDCSMGRIVNGVDVAERSGLARQAHNFGDVVDGAHGVGGVSHGDQFRATANFCRQILHVERAIGFVELDGADGHTFFFKGFPRGEVGVVIEQCEHDFVAGAEVSSEGAAQGEGERGHVRAEDDFVSIAIQKVGHGGPRLINDAIGIVAGLKGAVGVGVIASEIVGDGVDHALRHLRAAGAVEKDGGISVDGLRERRELRADPIYVERERGRRRRGGFRDGHDRHSNADDKCRGVGFPGAQK